MSKTPALDRFDLDRPVQPRTPGWMYVVFAGSLTLIAAAVLVVAGSWAYWSDQRSDLEVKVSALNEKVGELEIQSETAENDLAEARTRLTETTGELQSLKASTLALNANLRSRDREVERLTASPDLFPLIDFDELLSSVDEVRIRAEVDSRAETSGLREALVLEQMRVSLEGSSIRVVDEAGDLFFVWVEMVEGYSPGSENIYSVDFAILRRVVLPGHTQSTYASIHQGGRFGRLGVGPDSAPFETQLIDIVASIVKEFADSVATARKAQPDDGG